MKVNLVDTGALVAALNRRDSEHEWATRVLATLQPPLVTCEAVLAEACYLLKRVPDGPAALLELVARGLVRASFRLENEAEPVRQLLKRYASVRMDLADACLVRMTEIHADCELLTIDSEFRDVYRRRGRHAIPTVMPDHGRRR